MLHRTTKLQLAKDGKNKAFSSFDLYDHADRTSFSKLRNCFILTHCFQIISNCVVAKTVLKKKCANSAFSQLFYVIKLKSGRCRVQSICF